MTIPDLSDMLMENGGGISSIPCRPQEEKRIVTELTSKSESSLKQGNIYYVVSNRWFSSWQRFVGLISEATPSNEFVVYHQEEIFPETSARPGPIDNLDIIANRFGSYGENDDLDIIETLEEGRDYVLVPKEVWEKLFEWYKGGPALPRKMISQGARDDTYSIEVYPLRLNLIDSRDNSLKMIRLSKKTSISELYKRVCAITGVEKEKVRIWDYFNKEKHSELEVSDKSLQEANLEMGQDILLEVRDKGLSPGFSMDSTGNELALVAMEPSRSPVTIAGGPTLSNGPSKGYSNNLSEEGGPRSASSNMETGYNTKSTAAKSERGGLAGLQNLGNTCFMNSSIQCLVHTPPLVEYFLQDYADDINRDNPLGMHGDLAVAFGDLLRKLWSSGRVPVAPRLFKGKLARFAPQFSGYNQHDSQELLAFLLDGLHEDLNRVKRKPYIEAKDSDSRPDEEVAEECWKNHKARNDSLIVDVCQGQYKSTLVCPVCGKISITFDPFMYLSLPLPSTITRSMTVTVFYGDGSGLPMPYTVTISKRGSIKDLIESLNSACCLNVKEESLLIAEVYDNRIYRYFENPLEALSNIKDEERIVAYRLPKKRTGLTRLEIVHKYCEKSVSDNLKSGERKLLGCPLVTYLDSRLTGSDINAAVFRLLTPLRKKPYISSMNPNSCKTDGHGPVHEANGEPADNITGLSGDDVQSMDSDEIEEITGIGRDLFFHLYLIDDKGKILDSIESDDKELKPAPSYWVMLEWAEKALELYDSSYLKDLPEVKAGITVKKTHQEALSLFTCLEAFLKEEPLGPDDMWYCPGCKEHRQATKKLDLWRLPDILVFHLKRFSYSRYLKNKLDAFVNFPIHNLDLSKYVKSNVSFQESCVYELYAISNHYGGLGGGHYSAYAKLLDENKWYHFDDSHVSAVSEADIKTSAAYVLFYQRVKSETKMDLGEPSWSS